MSNIIKLDRRVIIPRQILKEEIDRLHRLDWEDSDRYQRQKEKALRYIPARAPDVQDFSWERLMREVKRVFHDDLLRDPDVIEAAQRCCAAAETAHRRDQDFGIAAPEPATSASACESERAPVRGVDDSDATLFQLEQELHDETTEP